MTFEALGLNAQLLEALAKEGYTTPTPIQQQAIPYILEKRDVLGCAQTGTGKTAAFALPMLQLFDRPNLNIGHKKTIKALILTPTRELALQIAESFSTYGSQTKLTNTVVFGGVSQKSQTDALHRGVDILIATPGRLLDLMSQGFVNLKDIEIFVLDEADRMLDMGFVNDVKKVITKLPAKRQTLFFSATMAPEIIWLAETMLVDPKMVEVTPIATTAETIQQSVYFVDKKDKKFLLFNLLETNKAPSVLIFTRTKHGANNLVKDLAKVNVFAEAIHGNKSQQARVKALTNFKTGKLRVLIATDIASRGIDIDDLSLVINYELPNLPETYVHRIGRTGRAGASGVAVSFCEGEERVFLRDIQRLIHQVIPMAENNPFESMDNSPIPLNQGNMPKVPVKKKPSNGGGSSRQSFVPSRPRTDGGGSNNYRSGGNSDQGGNRGGSGGNRSNNGGGGNGDQGGNRNGGGGSTFNPNGPRKAPSRPFSGGGRKTN